MTLRPERLHGALAAAVTPLRAGGSQLDEAAVGSLVDRYAAAGIDGVLALGSTGEGIMLEAAERIRLTEAFVEAAAGRLQVAAHCGAQSTQASVALAERAVAAGVDAVAAIGPPYYAFDPGSLLEHFAAIAAACAPTPFYLYEFAARSGYAVPPELIERLREKAPNLVGMKVSDAPFDRVRPYLLPGLDVFIGAEALLHDALAAGAAGAVSGLAAAFPEEVAAVVREPSAAGAAGLEALRAGLDPFPFQAALKVLLGLQGVAIGADCRKPIGDLTATDRDRLERLAADPGTEIGAAMARVTTTAKVGSR